MYHTGRSLLAAASCCGARCRHSCCWDRQAEGVDLLGTSKPGISRHYVSHTMAGMKGWLRSPAGCALMSQLQVTLLATLEDSRPYVRTSLGEARGSRVGMPRLTARTTIPYHTSLGTSLVIFTSALKPARFPFLSTPTLSRPEVRRLALLQAEQDTE